MKQDVIDVYPEYNGTGWTEHLGNEDPVETLVEREISRSLSEGIPKMADVARRLAMSERTLHRRLSERSVSFKSLVRKTRRHVAENLLRNSRYPVTEVAFLTGFSEQSAFHRAFKRWSGITPAQWRARHPGRRCCRTLGRSPRSNRRFRPVRAVHP